MHHVHGLRIRLPDRIDPLLLPGTAPDGGAAPGGSAAAAPAPIRPPGALPEGRFADRCIRCGNCMAVCPTSVIQPLLLGHGVSRLWTPAMAYDVGWCEYNCNRCGDACPTGAIAELGMPAKQGFVVGLARVDRTVCYPWTTEENCLVCEEQCPVPTKAIKVLRHTVRRGLVLKRPVVDAGLCIGCGACQNKCPASPVKAIRVGPPERGA